MQEVKNLVIPGIAGILLACAIFSAFAVAPWASTTPNLNFPKPPGWPSHPLNVKLIISNLTEPLGVGSEADLTVIVMSTRNVSNVVVQFDLLQVSSKWPVGISIGENITITNFVWNGDLRANVSMVLTQRIKAVEVGYAQIKATVTWSPYESFQYMANDKVWMLVLEDNIRISYEPITPPGQMPFLPPINATINSP